MEKSGKMGKIKSSHAKSPAADEPRADIREHSTEIRFRG
jgi:hypothetical protein